jgi:hypothetical protein
MEPCIGVRRAKSEESGEVCFGGDGFAKEGEVSFVGVESDLGLEPGGH